jgi:sterol desaturase/sphingolipid hydroxylase (fatty acid hydroxylase superfamily)
MDAEEIVALMIPTTFLVMMGIEKLTSSGRAWPEIPWWRTKGLAFFLVLMTINAALPSLVPAQIAQHHLINGAALGVAGGVLIGYPCVSFANALVHRAYHRYPLLWRTVHQLHHSPQRLDIPPARCCSRRWK